LLHTEAIVVDSFEDRQWRAKLEEARARVAQEEDEWSTLLARARRALELEEREWERLRARALVRSSGAFPAQPQAAASLAPPPIPILARAPEGR